MELTSRLMIWQELAESCGITTLQQSLQQVWRLLLLCLICRVCFRLVVSSTVKHVMSMLTGMYGLFLFLELHMLWVLLLSIICYLSLVLCRHSSNKGLFLSAVILVYLLIGHFWIQVESAFLPARRQLWRVVSLRPVLLEIRLVKTSMLKHG
ncbi:hypothetical protein ILYODFUR_022886 [Ilyodon furcidens]|uniref:Uncharacterized protein n=1 Tax=Ilyodon furcidens TaxID=33524 RepID=A0ABV0TAC7_9TELE